MFEKAKLKKAIKNSKKQIEQLEQKRSRSQAALVEAILKQTEPDDQDVDYFNTFTEKIEAERNNLHKLMAELEQIG